MVRSFNSNSVNADRLLAARVTDAHGGPLSVISVQASETGPLARVCTGNGMQILVPADLFAMQEDGSYRLQFAFGAGGDAGRAQAVFPVVQEQLHVGKRTVDTGRGVRLHKTVSEREQVVDQPLLQDELEVEHVALNAPVSESDPPQPRYEGDTLVVPVLEEVLVVQKQLRIREEVRIRRHKREIHAPQTVTLRSEQIAVEYFDEAAEARARLLQEQDFSGSDGTAAARHAPGADDSGARHDDAGGASEPGRPG